MVLEEEDNEERTVAHSGLSSSMDSLLERGQSSMLMHDAADSHLDTNNERTTPTNNDTSSKNTENTENNHDDDPDNNKSNNHHHQSSSSFNRSINSMALPHPQLETADYSLAGSEKRSSAESDTLSSGAMEVDERRALQDNTHQNVPIGRLFATSGDQLVSRAHSRVSSQGSMALLPSSAAKYISSSHNHSSRVRTSSILRRRSAKERRAFRVRMMSGKCDSGTEEEWEEDDYGSASVPMSRAAEVIVRERKRSQKEVEGDYSTYINTVESNNSKYNHRNSTIKNDNNNDVITISNNRINNNTIPDSSTSSTSSEIFAE